LTSAFNALRWMTGVLFAANVLRVSSGMTWSVLPAVLFIFTAYNALMMEPHACSAKKAPILTLQEHVSTAWISAFNAQTHQFANSVMRDLLKMAANVSRAVWLTVKHATRATHVRLAFKDIICTLLAWSPARMYVTLAWPIANLARTSQLVTNVKHLFSTIQPAKNVLTVTLWRIVKIVQELTIAHSARATSTT